MTPQLKKTLLFASIPLLTVGTVLGLVTFMNPHLFQTIFAERLFSRFQMQGEAILKADIYGGATPEETFGMYIDALKAGNIELASKYWKLDYQKDILKDLNQRNSTNSVNELIAEAEKAKEGWEIAPNDLNTDEWKTYTYSSEYHEAEVRIMDGEKVSVPAGYDALQVSFWKNTYSGIWKIDRF